MRKFNKLFSHRFLLFLLLYCMYLLDAAVLRFNCAKKILHCFTLYKLLLFFCYKKIRALFSSLTISLFSLYMNYTDDDDPVPIREKRSSSEHSPDIQMHIDQESETGGHWCAKIVFFALLSILIGLIVLIIVENRGMTEVAQPQGESRFSEYFEGWVEEPKDHDEEHHGVGDLHDEDDGDGGECLSDLVKRKWALTKHSNRR